MRNARSIRLASLLLVLLITTVVAGGVAASAEAITVKHVTIQNFSFVPRTLTIKAGTKVVWKNADTAVHQLASTKSIKTTAAITRLFHSGRMVKGSTFSFTFRKRGTFFYECTIHASMPSMHAEVIVK